MISNAGRAPVFHAIALTAFTLLAPAAHAAISYDQTIQVLDQIDIVGATNVKRSVEAPINLYDLDLDTSVGTALRACQNGLAGLTCLDGQDIRNWPLPQKLPLPAGVSSVPSQVLFSCLDPALALFGGTTGTPCVSATVDVKGSIWLSARKTSTAYSLIQLKAKMPTPSGLVCPSVEYSSLTNWPNYCFAVRRTGRAVMSEISAFDGELASRYRGNGIIAIEGTGNSNKAIFFPSDGTTPVEIGRSSNTGLLQSAALLQRKLPPTSPTSLPVVQTFALMTTSTGKVYWRNAASNSPGSTLIADANALTNNFPATGVVSFARGTACETGATPNFFEIRVSDTTGRIYIGNRNYCKLFAASPVLAPTAATITGLSGAETVLTDTGTAIKPEGISVSPGITVNLAACKSPNEADGCDYLQDSTDPGQENNIAAAKMFGVTLQSTSSGLLVFQIRNIPDCRKPANSDVAQCALPGVLVPTAKGTYLNVTPMLPQQIKDLFDGSGRKPFGLPRLLISPRYEAQAQNAYTFDALFGVTDPNVVFRGSFTAQFDVGDENLAGAKLGCGLFLNEPLKQFQEWDIVSVVSERFGGVGGPTGAVIDNPATPLVDETEHVDMLTNKGCSNPTAGAGTRWSLYSYNLALAETDPDGVTYAKPRLYLGNLIKSLYNDLNDVQNKLVCMSADASGNSTTPVATAPVSTAVCESLQADWGGTKDKLFKCIDAAVDPKQSQLDQNCQAFDTQFPRYYDYVKALMPTGDDPANRVGELLSRLDVINHVFYGHFLKAPLDQTVVVGP
jgi:hypothetical protein